MEVQETRASNYDYFMLQLKEVFLPPSDTKSDTKSDADTKCKSAVEGPAFRYSFETIDLSMVPQSFEYTRSRDLEVIMLVCSKS